MSFEVNVFYSNLVKGELTEAIAYLSLFPEQLTRYNKYVALFEKENYLKMADEPALDELLRIYQRYYRDVFYLGLEWQQAGERLCAGLSERFGNGSLDELEEAVKRSFESCGYSFRGGRTGGYYGPYIWKTTEIAEFEVELPEGTQSYHLRFLDGFVSKSWLDYISFGEVSTGGWTDGNGLINCVKASYDVNSENFRVSLLKHEAQHELDLRRCSGISSAELEYRAKLVELIYSRERYLLPQFILEADKSYISNGHGLAADWIKRRIPSGLSGEQLRNKARELFEESCCEMSARYAPIGK